MTLLRFDITRHYSGGDIMSTDKGWGYYVFEL